MSTREQLELLADELPEYKLAYVVAYMQGLLMADADEAADDAYCEKLLESYQNDPEKGQLVSFEDACKELGGLAVKWNIQIDKIALKFIAKQPAPQRVRIMEAISKLPDEGDIKPMAGQAGYYRLRVGTYRIIYMVKEEIITVCVTKAGNRGDIYK